MSDKIKSKKYRQYCHWPRKFGITYFQRNTQTDFHNYIASHRTRGLYVYNALLKYIDSKRGLKAYETMIADYEKDLLNPDITDTEKTKIRAEISTCKVCINKIKTDNIKIFDS